MRRAIAGLLDVRDGDAVRTWVDTVAERLGRIDVVVNNAGGGFFSPFVDVNDKGQDALDPRELHQRDQLRPRRGAAHAAVGRIRS